MCHCKTCTDRLHVIIVIIVIAIPYSLTSGLIRFPFLHTCFPFTSPRFYALPIVHDTSSKKAKVSSATTLFPWRHINTSKNHGYNPAADDSHRHLFRAEGSAFLPTKKFKRVEKVKHFRTIYNLRSFPDKCEICAKLGSDCFTNVRLYKVQTNKQTSSFTYKITDPSSLKNCEGWQKL